MFIIFAIWFTVYIIFLTINDEFATAMKFSLITDLGLPNY